MKSLFEEMGGTYRQVGDYFIPNLVLPDDGDYQIGKYGRMRRCYLEEHRKILCTNYAVEGTLFKHLSEIDQACNERTEIIIPAMAKQEGVTEALKATDQMEWVCRKLKTDTLAAFCSLGASAPFSGWVGVTCSGAVALSGETASGAVCSCLGAGVPPPASGCTGARSASGPVASVTIFDFSSAIRITSFLFDGMKKGPDRFQSSPDDRDTSFPCP